MNVATNRMVVPPSWIVLSNISGPACATIIQEGRNAGAVAQAPDQHMQFGQIAAVHSPWFPGSTTNWGDTAGPPEVHRVRVSGDLAQNMHVIICGAMEFISRSVVAGDALALGGHDTGLQAPAIVIPPALGMGIAVSAAPQAADDPRAAIDLPPLIQITRPQHQPDMAMGLFKSEVHDDSPFPQLAPLEEQTPVQTAGSRRPELAEHFAEPIFGRSIQCVLVPQFPTALARSGQLSP